MKRLLGTGLLILLGAASLWSLQHRDDSAAPPSTSAALAAPPVSSVASLAPLLPRVALTRPAPMASAMTTGTTRELSGEQGDAGDARTGDEWVSPTAPAVARDRTQAARFTAYEAAAVAFMTDFARPAPAVTAAQWWFKVKPHLAQRVVDDYAGTDPQLVPFQAVNGRAAVTPSDAPADLLTAVRVPTDAGPYLVEMETTEAGIHVTRAAPDTTRGKR